MSEEKGRSRITPSKTFIALSSSFSKQKKFVLTIDTVPCGDSFLYKHNDGYPLACKAVIKPLVMPLENVTYYTSEIVEEEIAVSFKVKEVSLSLVEPKKKKNDKASRISVRKSMKKGDPTRSGTGKVEIDNNFITLKRDTVTIFDACWLHLYGIYHGEDFGNNEIVLVFYKAYGNGLADGKSTLSNKVTEFSVLKLLVKGKDSLEETLRAIYSAVKGQTLYLKESASTLLRSNDPNNIDNAEAFYRTSVDLQALTTKLSNDRIKPIEDFLNYLEKYKPEEFAEEITFWKLRKKEILEEGLNNAFATEVNGFTI